MELEKQWWQKGIIYQIYVRSFQDSNNDGIGDLKGLISRLDYLEWLGIEAVWLSPIYASPMEDFGYDTNDHKAIDPVFGTMADFEELVNALHARGIKIIMDLMANQTSHQHPWFLESKSSRTNHKRDWYMWKDAKPDGSEPNNWLSAFDGSGWEWDEKTEQYYFHSFLVEQPDLNWRNEEVQEAVFDIMRFWLDKGVDGFRIDMMHHLIKDEHFRDNPANPDYNAESGTYNQLSPVYSCDQPYIHTVLHKMRALVNQYSDKVLIGELYVPLHKLVIYYGNDDGIHLPFNFLLIQQKWNPMKLASEVAKYDAALPHYAWPNWVMGNHDQPRIAARIGIEQARIAAIILLTLRGTPILHCGDELGLKGVPIPVDEIQDPQGKKLPDKNLGRDPMRSPMLWNGTRNAGFTNGMPWLRIDRDYKRLNVEAQRGEAQSMLLFYKKLFDLRRTTPCITEGLYVPVYSDSQQYAYLRKSETVTLLIVLNLSHVPCYLRLPEKAYKGKVLLSTVSEKEGTFLELPLALEGDEGLIMQLEEE